MIKRYSILTALMIVSSAFVLNAQYSMPELCAQRREALMMKAGGGVVIIPGSLRSPYGQNDISTANYFYYLTGWKTPGAWVIIEPGTRPRTTLFVTPTDPSQISWNNHEPGLNEAKLLHGHGAQGSSGPAGSREAEVNAFIKQVSPQFEKYKNTGVRIEDDILITSSGNQILSAYAPKEPREVEKLMKRRSRYE